MRLKKKKPKQREIRNKRMKSIKVMLKKRRLHSERAW